MSKNNLPVNPLGTEKVFFPSIDGLRFFAFFTVFLHHALPTPISDKSFIDHILITFKKNGWVGVDLFFVLSGFLITILLLKERAKYGNFSIKNFWIRRTLRIWPLYFLALLSGFFIIPFIYSQLQISDFSSPNYLYEIRSQLPFYLTFLGNWAVVLHTYSSFSNIAHLWTISLEEQFYLLWPLILVFIRSFKSALFFCILIIISATGFRYYLNSIGTEHPHLYVNTFARVDTLVFGSLIALILFYKPQIISKLRLFFNLPFQGLSLILLGIILYRISLFNPYLIRNGTLGYLVISVFMSYYILSSLQIQTLFSKFLTWRPLVYLGKISYGLYVWHILSIELINITFRNLNYPIIKIPLAFLLTIIISSISYRYFEQFFLKFKSNFTRISSRPV